MMINSSKKIIKTGYYSRLEWPQAGGVLNQYQIVIDIFSTIKDEESIIFANKVR